MMQTSSLRLIAGLIRQLNDEHRVLVIRLIAELLRAEGPRVTHTSANVLRIISVANRWPTKKKAEGYSA